MSLRTKALQGDLEALQERVAIAEQAHMNARKVFANFEGPCNHPMWSKLRDEVDSTLTHQRVLQAVWHRVKADLLDQLNADKE